MKPLRVFIALAVITALAALTVAGLALFGSDGDDTLTAADSAVRPAEAPASTVPVTQSSTTRATTSSTTSSAAPAPTTTLRPDPTTTTASTLPPPTTNPDVAPNNPPSVRITSPGSGSRFAATYNPADGTFGASVGLAVAVSDPEGDAYTVDWYSNLHGYLGSGASTSARLRLRGDTSQPVITAVVTDATGARGEARVQIIVWIPSDQ